MEIKSPNGEEARYVCLRGIVEPIDRSRLLTSTDGKSTGVIHKITVISKLLSSTQSLLITFLNC